MGHSLGLQPKRTAEYLAETLAVWRHQGVQGHFKQMKDVRTGPWVDIDDRVSEALAPIVGAKPSEVVAMQTLTANLQLIMAAFYKPDVNGKHKIIVESRAFPSDHVSA